MLPLLAQGTTESRLAGDYFASTRSIAKHPRKQVSKACDHCRLRRVNCDSGRPCRSCHQRGLPCNSRGTHNDEARTLPQALREIERLRLRVAELEAQLEEERQLRESSRTLTTPTQSSSLASSTPATTLPSTQTSSSSSKTSPSHSPEDARRKPHWEGIYTATARSEQTSYYGPSSAFYFIGRIGSYLSKSLQQPFTAKSMQPRGISRTLVSPTSPNDTDLPPERGNVSRPCMSRTQEEYFLGLFWESHHCNVPIIAEDEFRKLYDSLWQTSKPYRKPSALVDIVLAVSMQYGWAFLSRDTSSTGQSTQYDDSSIAGRWYYRRCQNLLAADLESPSITTLQCHLFSVIYLCCASFQNMAHTTLAVAVRTAEILGLHLEPPSSMPRSERELRKRLWALTYNIEAKTCMKLGRPFSVQKSQITVTPPSDDIETASFFGSSLGAYDGVTWLTYVTQISKLLDFSVDVYHQLFDKCAEVLSSGTHSSFYKDPGSLETCADFLTTLTTPLQAWKAQLPSGIKLTRRNGTPLSTDRSPILIDTSAPIWLQRHRICLELLYHTLTSNLHRPFITFSPSSLPSTRHHAVTCLQHAMAHTHIMHQVLSETDLMNGWQEFFLWQWNATVNMVGFLLAYPVHPSTSAARTAVSKAVEVFEVFGREFAVAESAAGVTRELMEKADLVAGRLRRGVVGGAESGIEADDERGLAEGGDAAGSGTDVGLVGARSEDETGNGFSEFMDWALTVDSFNSFEDLFADANTGMDWWNISS